MNSIFLHNGKIWTGDRDKPVVEALYIEGNTIRSAGRTREIQPLLAGDVFTVDLKGRTVLPGFSDTHMHLSEWAKREKQLHLDGFTSLEALLAYVRENLPDSEWVLGGGWNYNVWEEHRLPTAEDLSFISPLQKVVFFSKDFHSAWVNDSVIDMINPRDMAKYIDLNQIQTNSIGQLTGIFREDAMMQCIVPLVDQQPSPLFNFPMELFEKFFEFGITSLHSIETFQNYRNLRNLYQNRVHRGPRLGIYVYHHDKQQILDYHMKSGDGGPWLRFLGLKYFLDGSLGSQTAWMSAPYEGMDDYTGVRIWDGEELRRDVAGTEEAHLKLAVHAIGDAAVDEALKLLEGRSPFEGIPDRIEHVQLCSPELLDRLERQRPGITANPSHLLSDFPTAEKYWGERSRHAFALKSMLDRNLPVTFASDAPVEHINPWLSITAAVHRIPDYSGISWYPQERISMDDALTMMIVNSASLSGESEKKGKLLPGYFADLFVCSKDPFSVEIPDIVTIRSLLTILDGQIVLDRLNS